MVMSESEARKKLQSAFNRGNFTISLSSRDRKEELVELLKRTDESNISEAVFKAIRFYIREKSEPTVEEMKEKLARNDLANEDVLNNLESEKIKQIYHGYFAGPYEGEGEANIDIQLNGEDK